MQYDVFGCFISTILTSYCWKSVNFTIFKLIHCGESVHMIYNFSLRIMMYFLLSNSSFDLVAFWFDLVSDFQILLQLFYPFNRGPSFQSPHFWPLIFILLFSWLLLLFVSSYYFSYYTFYYSNLLCFYFHVHHCSLSLLLLL